MQKATILIKPTKSHVEMLASALMDDEVNHLWYGKAPDGVPNHVGYSPYKISDDSSTDSFDIASKVHIIYTIALPDQMPIGEGQLHLYPLLLEAQLYILIYRKDLWYKGYGTSALSNLLHEVFDEQNLHRAYMDIPSNNAPAIHMAENTGFILEGKLRGTHYLDGVWQDSLVYGLLIDEYHSRTKSIMGS